MSTEQYFFQFSSGSYSNYSVGGLYVCDHAVPLQEWKEHYEDYCDNLKATKECAMIAYGERVGCGHRVYTYHTMTGETTAIRQDHKDWWGSAEAEGVRKWEEDNDPECTFIALHNMTYVEVTECWRDI